MPAALYINWLLSRQGAEVFNANVEPGRDNKPHLRSDVSQGVMLDVNWEIASHCETIVDSNTDEFRVARDESLAWWQAMFDELGLNP